MVGDGSDTKANLTARPWAKYGFGGSVLAFIELF